MSANDMRRCDIEGIRRLWATVARHLPQPASDAEALVMLHRARTETRSIAFRLRAYSHRWLTERGLPSALPDELRPRAERMFPVIVDAVGVAVKSRSGEFKPVAEAVQRAMSDTVAEMYADGVKDPVLVKARMMEARSKTLDKLLGRGER
jgi:predicted metal-dependent phosphoesterase TrpH